jgi:hypothetical protein
MALWCWVGGAAASPSEDIYEAPFPRCGVVLEVGQYATTVERARFVTLGMPTAEGASGTDAVRVKVAAESLEAWGGLAWGDLVSVDLAALGRHDGAARETADAWAALETPAAACEFDGRASKPVLGLRFGQVAQIGGGAL